jgi:hypothetical protein
MPKVRTLTIVGYWIGSCVGVQANLKILFVQLYRWFPSILSVLTVKPAIMVRDPDTTTQPPPQDHQLMPKRRVLGFKPQPRL